MTIHRFQTAGWLFIFLCMTIPFGWLVLPSPLFAAEAKTGTFTLEMYKLDQKKHSKCRQQFLNTASLVFHIQHKEIVYFLGRPVNDEMVKDLPWIVPDPKKKQNNMYTPNPERSQRYTVNFVNDDEANVKISWAVLGGMFAPVNVVPSDLWGKVKDGESKIFGFSVREEPTVELVGKGSTPEKARQDLTQEKRAFCKRERCGNNCDIQFLGPLHQECPPEKISSKPERYEARLVFVRDPLIFQCVKISQAFPNPPAGSSKSITSPVSQEGLPAATTKSGAAGVVVTSEVREQAVTEVGYAAEGFGQEQAQPKPLFPKMRNVKIKISLDTLNERMLTKLERDLIGNSREVNFQGIGIVNLAWSHSINPFGIPSPLTFSLPKVGLFEIPSDQDVMVRVQVEPYPGDMSAVFITPGWIDVTFPKGDNTQNPNPAEFSLKENVDHVTGKGHSHRFKEKQKAEDEAISQANLDAFRALLVKFCGKDLQKKGVQLNPGSFQTNYGDKNDRRTSCKTSGRPRTHTCTAKVEYAFVENPSAVTCYPLPVSSPLVGRVVRLTEEMAERQLTSEAGGLAVTAEEAPAAPSAKPSLQLHLDTLVVEAGQEIGYTLFGANPDPQALVELLATGQAQITPVDATAGEPLPPVEVTLLQGAERLSPTKHNQRLARGELLIPETTTPGWHQVEVTIETTTGETLTTKMMVLVTSPNR